MIKKLAAILLLVTSLGVFLGGCSKSDDGTTDSGSTTTTGSDTGSDTKTNG